MDVTRPDYGGAWIGALMPALLTGTGPDWMPSPAQQPRGVVLLVLDGLGSEALREHGDRMPVLTSLDGRSVTTTVPSTTATALTSITTGLVPAEHGIVGYRMRVGGELLNVLRWELANGKPPQPAAVQPRQPFLGREVPAVTRAEFAGGGFTDAHLRGVRYCGWRSPAGILTYCRKLVAAGERFVYLYYDGIDKVAHAHGLRDGFYTDELAAADRLVAEVLDVLPDDYALVVTADHGQVHLDPADWHPLDAVRGLVSAYAGDGRFRSLHARPGATRDLLDAARAAYRDIALVLTREELVTDGWMGAVPGASVAGRMGDVVLAATGSHAFVDPTQPDEARMRSGHGSVTAAEMLVPLLAARGRA